MRLQEPISCVTLRPTNDYVLEPDESEANHISDEFKHLYGFLVSAVPDLAPLLRTARQLQADTSCHCRHRGYAMGFGREHIIVPNSRARTGCSQSLCFAKITFIYLRRGPYPRPTRQLTESGSLPAKSRNTLLGRPSPHNPVSHRQSSTTHRLRSCSYCGSVHITKGTDRNSAESLVMGVLSQPCESRRFLRDT
jgi:hypothetical protein